MCRTVLTNQKHEVILVVRLESVNPLRKRWDFLNCLIDPGATLARFLLKAYFAIYLYERYRYERALFIHRLANKSGKLNADLLYVCFWSQLNNPDLFGFWASLFRIRHNCRGCDFYHFNKKKSTYCSFDHLAKYLQWLLIPVPYFHRNSWCSLISLYLLNTGRLRFRPEVDTERFERSDSDLE